MTSKCEESLSTFAFSCNLRHYTEADAEAAEAEEAAVVAEAEADVAEAAAEAAAQVGRCRSNPG